MKKLILLSAIFLLLIVGPPIDAQSIRVGVQAVKVNDSEAALASITPMTGNGFAPTHSYFDLRVFDGEGIHKNAADTFGFYQQVADQGGSTLESCHPRISYAIRLAHTLGQRKQLSGVETRGNLMELYTNPKSGTWTLVLVLPRGLVCEIGSGTEFQIEPHPHKV